MQIIRLPKHLPSSSELMQLNQRLLAGEIRLDWRDVTSVGEPGQLESLLKGLKLTEHYDSLGADTVPESLQPILVTLFVAQDIQTKHKPHKIPSQAKRQSLVKPEIWLPEAENAADQNDSNKANFRIFSKSDKQTVLPQTPGRSQDETSKKSVARNVPTTQSKQVQAESSQKKAALQPTSALRDTIEAMILTEPSKLSNDEVRNKNIREHYFISLIAHKETQMSPVKSDRVSAQNTLIELPALADLCLDMQLLAIANPNELKQMFMPLLNIYTLWIEELQGFAGTAHKAIQQCQAERQSIQAGIDLLTKDTLAAQAFTSMNRAMWLQRIHTAAATEKRQQGSRSIHDLDQPIIRSWRPFQLAFILINLPTLTTLQPSEQSTTAKTIIDLRWLIADGSKTEAYLGLTAYTLIIRRLQAQLTDSSKATGVEVVMRYPSHLLTAQKFQHTAALICACESIRRPVSAIWGETPFRLGLWEEQSAQSVISSHFNHTKQGDLRQLTNCPWCGCEIDPVRDILVEIDEEGHERTFIYCSDPAGSCQFSRARSRDDGLPILVVQEEIYHLEPSLLLATVERDNLAFFHKPDQPTGIEINDRIS